MALERLTRISGPGISSDLSVTFSGTSSFNNVNASGIITASSIDVPSFDANAAGVIVTGVATATSFSGPLTGNVTGNVTGDVTGNLTGNVTSNTTVSGILTATSFYGSAIGLSGIGEGNTYYVSVDGSDTNSGDGINRPLRTVKQALSVATSGDLIHVGVGTFSEAFPLTVPQGVGIRGAGIRGTFIEPTSGTRQNDCFLLNGETEITDLTVGNMYEPGWAFRFADNMKTNLRSPYVQRVTVLNRGSAITATDPYGFDTTHNPPTSYKAGRGALIDGSVVQSSTLEPAMLFNECTFITPNNTALKMTNGARSEWVNCFSYFADKAIDAVSGNVGLASTGSTRIKVSSVTGTTPAANDQLYYLDSSVSGTYSQSGTTNTITRVGHGLTVGDRIYADFTSGSATDGYYRVTGYVGVNTFSVTMGSSATTSGNVTYKEALGFGTVTAYTTSPTTIITLQGKGEGRFQTATSRSGKTVTGYGGARISTTEKVFGTASASFDGTGDYLSTPNNSDFDFGTGAFCLETRVRINSQGETHYLISKGSDLILRINSSNKLVGQCGVTTITGTTTIAANTWYTALFSRTAAGALFLSLNGTSEGTGTDTTNINNSNALEIGGWSTNDSDSLNGYLDELRVSNVVRQTGAYTPATSAFVSDTSTKLLLHFDGDDQSSIFTDSTIQEQDVVFVRSGTGIATATNITLADYQQFGADMRSIGSAAVFGNTGINADGLGVNLRLFAFNFGHIGSGKDFSQDESLVNQESEVIENNGANVSYVSIDQKGDFRVGSAFYVNEERGIVSFGGQESNISSLSNLDVTDGTNSTTITPTSVTTGNIQLNGNTVTTTSGDLTINPSGISSTFVTGDLTVSGNVTGGFNLGISSAGTSITSGPITRLNFVGTGNTFAVNGTTVDVSISGGGGGSSLTVKEVASQGGATNVTVNNVSEIQFNNGSGFNVSDQGSGTAFVDLGSNFNPWYVSGQTTLAASGEEPIEIVAGPGIAITTKATASVGIGTTFSKALTISAKSGLSSQEVTTGTTNVIAAIMGSEPRTQDWLTYWPNGAVPPGGGGGTPSYFPAANSGIATHSYEFSFRIGIGYQSLLSPFSNYSYLNRKPHYRKIITSQGTSIGIAEAFANYNRNSSYTNVTTMIMPIRNTSGSNINVPVYHSFHCAGGTNMGAAVFSMTPVNSSGTTYSTVTSVTYGQIFTTLDSYLSNGSPQIGLATVTIPAGKTVLVVITESSWQITSNTAHRFSAFYRLQNTFANANIQCDLRMVETMANADFYNLGWTNNAFPSGQEYRVWNACGTLYGDR